MVRTGIIICLLKNINILYHYIISAACVLVSHTMCVQNRRKVITNNVEPIKYRNPLFIYLCLH